MFTLIMRNMNKLKHSIQKIYCTLNTITSRQDNSSLTLCYAKENMSL